MTRYRVTAEFPRKKTADWIAQTIDDLTNDGTAQVEAVDDESDGLTPDEFTEICS